MNIIKKITSAVFLFASISATAQDAPSIITSAVFDSELMMLDVKGTRLHTRTNEPTIFVSTLKGELIDYLDSCRYKRAGRGFECNMAYVPIGEGRCYMVSFRNTNQYGTRFFDADGEFCVGEPTCIENGGDQYCPQEG